MQQTFKGLEVMPALGVCPKTSKCNLHAVFSWNFSFLSLFHYLNRTLVTEATCTYLHLVFILVQSSFTFMYPLYKAKLVIVNQFESI